MINSIRDKLEFLEVLGPIIDPSPRRPISPSQELTTITKQLLVQLSTCEKEGKKMPEALEVHSTLDAKGFQELLELLGFKVVEMTAENIVCSISKNYHVQLEVE